MWDHHTSDEPISSEAEQLKPETKALVAAKDADEDEVDCVEPVHSSVADDCSEQVVGGAGGGNMSEDCNCNEDDDGDGHVADVWVRGREIGSGLSERLRDKVEHRRGSVVCRLGVL